MTVEMESRKTPLQTEFQFILPKGYVDEGIVHREGVMRLATAADEISPLRDPRVKSNPAFLSCIVLARTIQRIGDIESVTTNVIENLFASDLAFLQAFYKQINSAGNSNIHTKCPKCETQFETELAIPDG